MKFAQVFFAFFSAPWAIDPDKYELIRSILFDRIRGDEPTAERVQAATDARRPESFRQEGKVAIVPIMGVIVPRGGAMEKSSGAVSAESIGRQVDAAAADKGVNRIILQIDSPGGSVQGVTELAGKIRAARDVKKVIAVADGTAASAAYWLGSQASEFYATPSGRVGAIGVISEYVDRSKADESMGVKSTVITAGKYKGLNRGEPLSEEGAAKIQADVNHYYDMFVGDVAKGRGVSDATVRNGYGEGLALVASEAKAAGMIDGIKTFESVLRMALGTSTTAVAAAARARAVEVSQ
jgi:capsid assembly protease